MEYVIDTADVEAIRKAFEFLPMDGVTTNPSLIAKQKGDFFAILREIRSVIGPGAQLHAQAIGPTAAEMVLDARKIRDVAGGRIYVKIPVTPEGYKAMKALRAEDPAFGITATAVFTPQQALLAAKAGADYVAPYVNRIDNISGNGAEVVADIVQLFETFHVGAKVLAASFKSVQQVHECALAGCHAATVAPDILWKLVAHPLTDAAVDGFTADWRSVYGDRKPAEG